ncbi:hypothetical protein MMC21_008358 [Puttea exsequens]|nr:hypothetical protein [Puttea exsequens]
MSDVNNDNLGTKIEASTNGADNNDIDVSYVDGYTVPITCTNGIDTVTGCNIDLWKATQPCSEIVGHNVCKNTLKLYRNKTYIGPAAPWFQPCQHAAYTYPADNGANKGTIKLKDMACCIGTADQGCPAPAIQSPFSATTNSSSPLLSWVKSTVIAQGLDHNLTEALSAKFRSAILSSSLSRGAEALSLSSSLGASAALSSASPGPSMPSNLDDSSLEASRGGETTPIGSSYMTSASGSNSSPGGPMPTNLGESTSESTGDGEATPTGSLYMASASSSHASPTASTESAPQYAGFASTNDDVPIQVPAAASTALSEPKGFDLSIPTSSVPGTQAAAMTSTTNAPPMVGAMKFQIVYKNVTKIVNSTSPSTRSPISSTKSMFVSGPNVPHISIHILPFVFPLTPAERESCWVACMKDKMTTCYYDPAAGPVDWVPGSHCYLP